MPAKAPVSERPKDFLVLHRVDRLHDLAAILILMLVLCVVRFSAVSAHLHCLFGDTATCRYLGGYERDAGLYVWLMLQNARDLFHNAWFETSAFYPYGRSLAWSDNFILPSLCAEVLLKLGFSNANSYNTLIFAAHLLNGFAVYKLVFRLAGSSSASVCAGTAFMASPYFLGNLGHPQLQFAFWIPLMLLATFRFVAYPSAYFSFVLAILTVAAFLTTVQYAIFGLLAAHLLLIGVILLRPKYLRLRDYLHWIVGLALGLPLLIPFVRPYLDVQAVFGERHLYEAFYFSATGLSYITTTPFSLLYSFSANWSHPEGNLFAGLIVTIFVLVGLRRLAEAQPLRSLAILFAVAVLATLILSSVAQEDSLLLNLTAVTAWSTLLALTVFLSRLGQIERFLGFTILTNRALFCVVAFVAIVFLILSLGPLGNPENNQIAAGPFTPLFLFLPGFSSIRACARLGVVTILCFCTLFGLSAAHHTRKRATRLPVLAGLLALVTLEGVARVYPLEPQTPSSAIAATIAAHAAPADALIVLPFSGPIDKLGDIASWSEFARLNVNHMLTGLESRLPVVNGYSGQRTKLMRELAKHLFDFPSEKSTDALAQIANLHFVLYRSRFVSDFDAAAFSKEIEKAKDRLVLIASDPSGDYLFELSGATHLTSFKALVPPQEPGKLGLKLVAPPLKDTPILTLNLTYISDQGEQELAPIKLLSDGLSKEYFIELPDIGDRVRPRQVQITARDKDQIVLQAVRFHPDSVVEAGQAVAHK